jgi:23S rRNA (guanosine2251-2'-O)-methyltransferase
MLIYGYHPVREALLHRPQSIDRVLVARRRSDPKRQEIEHLCRRHEVKLVSTSTDEISKIADGVHNGLVAEVREEQGALESTVSDNADAGLIVLLEDVQDPRNLGALLRVCEGTGVGRVLIRDRGSAPISPAVSKTAAGAAEWLAIERMTNSFNALDELKKEGYWIYGAVAGGQAPWTFDLSGKVVLCLGGEEKGLRDRTRKACDGLVSLPMKGHVDSLNVATAAAAILYEIVRQREKIG